MMMMVAFNNSIYSKVIYTLLLVNESEKIRYYLLFVKHPSTVFAKNCRERS